MNDFITREGIKRIAILTVVVIVCLIAYYPFSPGGRQATAIRRAEKHDELLNRQLALDPRFQQVMVYTYVGENVRLEIEGEIDTWEDRQALYDIVTHSALPVPVRWNVSLAMTSWVDGVVLTGAQDGANIVGLSPETNSRK